MCVKPFRLRGTSRNGRPIEDNLPALFFNIDSSLSVFFCHKEKNMKKLLRRPLFVLPIAVIAFLFLAGTFSGCDFFGTTDDPIAVKGTWVIGEEEPQEKWIIKGSSIEYLSVPWGGDELATNYKADIVEYFNSGLNVGDTEIYTGGSDKGLGFAVIKFTEVNGPSTGEVGKHQIFRWATNQEDSSKRDFTQGYKNVGDPYPNNVNEVFDTPEAAKVGATNANGHFAYASEGAVKQ